MHKTNAVRLLDQLGVRYELREYQVDPDDLAAQAVARKIGLPPEQVFKTLVARGDRNGVCLAVVPGDAELNLKSLAAAAGDRKIQLVPLKELLGLTGYIRGGVTALAGKKDYPVFADETNRTVRTDFDFRRPSRGSDSAGARRLFAGDEGYYRSHRRK